MRKLIVAIAVTTALLFSNSATAQAPAAPEPSKDFQEVAQKLESLRSELEATRISLEAKIAILKEQKRRAEEEAARNEAIVRLMPYIAMIYEVRREAGVVDDVPPEDVAIALESAYNEFDLASRGMTLEDWFSQVKVESNFNTRAVGTHQDTGLTQFIPSTAYWLNDKYFGIENFSMDMLFDPALSARFGAKYMQILIDQYGDVHTALEVYNKGPKGIEYTDYRERVFAVSRQYFRR